MEQKPDANTLVVLKKFSHPLEAHLLKTRLESEGIESFVADENMVNLNWLYSNAIGGVRLQVKLVDLEKAQAIVSEIELNTEVLPAEDAYVNSYSRVSKITFILLFITVTLFLTWMF